MSLLGMARSRCRGGEEMRCLVPAATLCKGKVPYRLAMQSNAWPWGSYVRSIQATQRRSSVEWGPAKAADCTVWSRRVWQRQGNAMEVVTREQVRRAEEKYCRAMQRAQTVYEEWREAIRRFRKGRRRTWSRQ